MEIPFERVPVDNAVLVAVLVDNLLEFDCRFGEGFEGEGDVFDEGGGADFSRAADGREDAGANRPPGTVNGGVFGELDGRCYRSGER